MKRAGNKMKVSDWDNLHVGATIHLPDGNFYVSTVELLGTEERPKGIGQVWDRHSKRLTKYSVVMSSVWSLVKRNYTPCPGTRSVIGNRVILPGNPDWPEATRYWFKAERGEHNYSQEILDSVQEIGNG